MNKKYLVFLFLLTIGITLFTPCYDTTAEGGLFPPGWKEGIDTDTKGPEKWVEGLPGNAMIKWVISGLIGAVATILLLITQTFMKFSQTLLSWITSEGFISVNFTSNSFVDIGWSMIRDLTNILIVLGLVVIALATILRISSYQMKKTLPLLLAVALLINFTPMLCGIVIDASNITMNHFLKAGLYLTQSYGSVLKSAGSELLSQIGSPSGMLATGLLLVGSSLFSGIIFLLYSALFLFRYIALWMLVILSPLALFCYIFPGTKKMWNMWLSQFMQWCFIGIPAAFTIYLANEMTRLMLQGELLGEMSSMGKIMGYIVPVSFLAAGFFISLQTGAMGASFITSNARKAIPWGAKLAGTGAEKATRRPRKWIGEKLMNKRIGKHETGTGGENKKARGGLLGYAGRGLTANIARHEREEGQKAKELAKGKSFEEQNVLLHSPSATKRIQALQTIIEEGNIDKIEKAVGFGDKDKEKIMRDTLKLFPSSFKTFAKSEIKIAEKIVGKTGKEIEDNLAKEAGVFMDEKDIIKYKTVSQKLAATASEKDISKWSKQTMNTALESEVFHKSLKGSKISAMAKQFGDDFFESFKNNVANEVYYSENVPAAHKYISNNAGKNLGIDFNQDGKETPGLSHEETTDTGPTNPDQPDKGTPPVSRRRAWKKLKKTKGENLSPGKKEEEEEVEEDDESKII